MPLRSKFALVGAIALLGILLLVSPWSSSQEREVASASLPTTTLRIPTSGSFSAPAITPHPLTQALDLAYDKLDYVREHVQDYTCLMVKRERIDGELLPYEYIRVKCRHRRSPETAALTPLGIYLKYFEPKALKGREVLFVEGRDNNQMLVRKGGGRTGFVKLWLDPNGMLAMQQNRYPITEFALDNLILRLIQIVESDLQYDECKVAYNPDATINGRPCLGIEVTHPEQRDYFQFHIARVFLDDELQVPIHFELLLWPSEPGGDLPLLEMYSFRNMKLNVGLTDTDFDRANPDYGF